jgi:Fe-S-cluster-containing dehydrogenase component
MKLGLVIDLDVCVGCHACATACKEWNGESLMAGGAPEMAVADRAIPAPAPRGMAKAAVAKGMVNEGFAPPAAMPRPSRPARERRG